MASLAAHWVDRVLPDVGLRQWVLTVPWPRRWLLARRPDLARGVLGVAIRTLSRFLTRRAAARGHPGGRTGSITVVQRFGSALNLNLHFHILSTDGVYVRKPDGLRFVRDRPVTTDEVSELVVKLATRAERWLARRGFGPDDGEEPVQDDALPLMQAASVEGRSAVSGGRRARRFQVHRGRAYALPPRCATWGGYTLHGGVAVGGRDRGGRERLCRYMARPALARTRIEETPAGLVRLTFKRPWADGTAGVTFTPLEFIERLAALVPPPRAHLVHYHGVLAGRSAWRREVVPDPPATARAQRPPLRKGAATPSRTHRYLTWAELLWRVFAVDGWRCPTCGGLLTLRAVPWPRATLSILDGLDAAAARAPPAIAHRSA